MTLDIEEFQNIIGIRFDQPDLLQQALTHRSYLNERPDDDLEDNERLEYLGDAILDFIAADVLYRRFPDMDEGHLTRLRAALVRTEALATLAESCRIGEALIMGKGESNGGGRERTHTLCNAFEAVVGAIYLDQGLETVKSFVIPRLTELQHEVMEEATLKDPRSLFQEWAQAELSLTPEYRTTHTSGPDHDKEFTIEVRLGDIAISQGQGKSKRSAAQSAAEAALERVKRGEIDL
jgi:ribonuclease-3